MPVPVDKISVDSGDKRVPTVDGKRVVFTEINVGEATDKQEKAGGLMMRLRRKLALFLAGMYTGIGCSGVPHSHHTYGPDRDNRPL
ncbi:MAG: hypothetical protein R3F50_16010 [Gammaproteobacteria bacterium]